MEPQVAASAPPQMPPTMPPEPRAAPRRPPVLRLDKNRLYSECKGERTVDDPHKDVHYFQHGLPFDANGLLVEDDGKTLEWRHQVIEDNGATKTIIRYPLYTDEMRATRDRLLRRLERKREAPGDSVGEVDFVEFLRGHAKYSPTTLYDAMEAQYSRRFSRVRDVVDELIYEQQVLSDREVAPHILDLLEQDG